MPKVKVKKTAKAASRKTTEKAVKRVTQEDINRNFKEIQRAQKETERMLNQAIKTQEETKKTLNEAIGGLSKTIGNMTESMLIPSLTEKFKKLGFNFEIISPHRRINSDKYDIHTEIDAFLENSSQAMAVEVKTTLKHDDVDYHIERMEKIRRFADFHNDKRQFSGAIAANVIDEDTKRYALKQGFYIIEPSGEDVRIVKPVSAKVW